ncbi:MAG TPA: ABC transporter permease subunit, partial [Anaerolineales bacterium]|nr:ABC transporter permease subunit [Anaerolineales bacterium]
MTLAGPRGEERRARGERYRVFRSSLLALRSSPLLLTPLLFLALFYAWPLGAILARSLAPEGGLDLGPGLAVLGRASTWSVIGFTLWQATLSTIATVLVGLPGAYLIGRYDFPGKRWLRALSGVPFVLPTLVVGAGFSALLGDRGVVNQTLMSWLGLKAPPVQVLGSLGAIVLGHVFYNTTLIIRLVGDAWARLDPRPLAAARTLGASPAKAFVEVTLPLLAPSLGMATLLVFTFDVASFGVILILGGPRFATLETEIYRQAMSLFNLPGAAVLTLIQLSLTLGLALAYNRLASAAAR